MVTLAHDICDVHGVSSLYIKPCLQSSFIYMYNMYMYNIHIYKVFLTGAMGECPPPAKNLLIPPSPANFYYLPTKSQFNLINKIKTSFLAVVIAAVATIFVLIFYSLETEIMLILILIDVQYSQNAVFSFENFSNRQNHSSSGSHHLIKKSYSSAHYFLTQSQGNS